MFKANWLLQLIDVIQTEIPRRYVEITVLVMEFMVFTASEEVSPSKARFSISYTKARGD